MHDPRDFWAGELYVQHLLFGYLQSFLSKTHLGHVFMRTAFLPAALAHSAWNEQTRIPDLLFIAQRDWLLYRQQNPDWRNKPYLLVPDLVVEVVSPNDKVIELDEKIDKYLEDGVKLIWVINPQGKKAQVYRAGQTAPQHFTSEDTLDGEDVLPQFQLVLADLFAELADE